MKVSDVISRVRAILNDEDATGYRWTNAELISWINDSQRVVAVFRPDACPGDAVVTLVAGTKQSIPTDGFRLLDVMRNIGSDGVTPGRAIRIVNRDLLDSYEPDWHSGTKQSTIKHFMNDERNPTVFHVYPPAVANTKVEVLYAKFPVTLTQTTDDLGVTDSYMEFLVNYTLFKSYAKDAEYSNNAQLSSQYLQAASGLLGVKLQKDIAYSPQVNRKGGEPSPATQMGGV